MPGGSPSSVRGTCTFSASTQVSGHLALHSLTSRATKTHSNQKKEKKKKNFNITGQGKIQKSHKAPSHPHVCNHNRSQLLIRSTMSLPILPCYAKDPKSPMTQSALVIAWMDGCRATCCLCLQWRRGGRWYWPYFACDQDKEIPPWECDSTSRQPPSGTRLESCIATQIQ